MRKDKACMGKIGTVLKTIRASKGETLRDMAKILSVSPAFLSSVECGKRSAPVSWIVLLHAHYRLDKQTAEVLQNAVYDTVSQVRINVAGLDLERRKCALTFAQMLPSITKHQALQIISILQQGVNQ